MVHMHELRPLRYNPGRRAPCARLVLCKSAATGTGCSLLVTHLAGDAKRCPRRLEFRTVMLLSTHKSVRNVQLICILRDVGTIRTESFRTHAAAKLVKHSRCNFVRWRVGRPHR